MALDIFISYAHKDKKDVIPVIEDLRSCGYDVWYDGGIEAGEDWAGKIGATLESASLMLLFLTCHSIRSANVMREITFAQDHNIPIVTVQIGKVKISEELHRRLMANQMLDLYSYKTYSDLVAALRPALKRAGIVHGETNTIKNKKIPHRHRHLGLWIFLGLLCAAAVAVILPKLLFFTVPNVLGLQGNTAQSRVEDVGCPCILGMDYTEEEEYGYVYQQSCTGRVFRSTTVVLTQSLGPGTNLVDMPDTVGLAISQGIAKLVDVGMLRFVISAQVCPEFPVTFIADQSIPAGLRVSRENRPELTVSSAQETLDFTYGDQTLTIPTGSKFEVVVGSDGRLIFTPMPLSDITLDHTGEYAINNDKTIFADVMMKMDLTRQDTTPTGRYCGAITFDTTITNRDGNLVWKMLTKLFGNEDGIITAGIAVDPYLVDVKTFDKNTYETFVAQHTDGQGKPHNYLHPLYMATGESFTLSRETFATRALGLMSRYQELLNISLPRISGGTIYQPYAIVVDESGEVYVSLYGNAGSDRSWSVKGWARYGG